MMMTSGDYMLPNNEQLPGTEMERVVLDDRQFLIRIPIEMSSQGV